MHNEPVYQFLHIVFQHTCLQINGSRDNLVRETRLCRPVPVFDKNLVGI